MNSGLDFTTLLVNVVCNVCYVPTICALTVTVEFVL